MDFADPDAPGALVSAVSEAFGHLDVVVANHARGAVQSPEELTAGEIDLAYAVNTRATLLLVRHSQPVTAAAGWSGDAVHLGSAPRSLPAELPYLASKAALRELTTSLAAHRSLHRMGAGQLFGTARHLRFESRFSQERDDIAAFSGRPCANVTCGGHRALRPGETAAQSPDGARAHRFRFSRGRTGRGSLGPGYAPQADWESLVSCEADRRSPRPWHRRVVTRCVARRPRGQARVVASPESWLPGARSRTSRRQR